MIASASEDNTVRLWHADGNCLQVIEHPGCVWDVAFLPGGDLVTACSDYAVRVWTGDSHRVADKEIITARWKPLCFERLSQCLHRHTHLRTHVCAQSHLWLAHRGINRVLCCCASASGKTDVLVAGL